MLPRSGRRRQPVGAVVQAIHRKSRGTGDQDRPETVVPARHALDGRPGSGEPPVRIVLEGGVPDEIVVRADGDHPRVRGRIHQAEAVRDRETDEERPRRREHHGAGHGDGLARNGTGEIPEVPERQVAIRVGRRPREINRFTLVDRFVAGGRVNPGVWSQVPRRPDGDLANVGGRIGKTQAVGHGQGHRVDPWIVEDHGTRIFDALGRSAAAEAPCVGERQVAARVGAGPCEDDTLTRGDRQIARRAIDGALGSVRLGRILDGEAVDHRPLHAGRPHAVDLVGAPTRRAAQERAVDAAAAEPETEDSEREGAKRGPGGLGAGQPETRSILFHVSAAGPHRDMDHSALRCRALVIVAVAVQVENIFRVGRAQTVEIGLEGRRAGVVARGVGGPVADRDDERDRRVALRLVHERRRLDVPFGQRSGPGLRVGDEPDVVVVEPVPVFTAAADGGGPDGGLRIRELEASLVVPQIVAHLRSAGHPAGEPAAVGGAVPLVVAPDRHRRRILRPDHDVVEKRIDVGLSVSVGVIQVPDRDDEIGRVDQALNLRHPDVGGGIADIPLRINGKAERPAACRERAEQVVGAAADGVMIRGALYQAGDPRLPERPGRGERRRGRRRSLDHLTVRRRRTIAHLAVRAAPVQGDRFRSAEGPVNLIVGNCRRRECRTTIARGRCGPHPSRPRQENHDAQHRYHARDPGHQISALCRHWSPLRSSAPAMQRRESLARTSIGRTVPSDDRHDGPFLGQVPTLDVHQHERDSRTAPSGDSRRAGW